MNAADEETDAAEPLAEPAPQRPSHFCPVVGVGASAGGLDALKRLFAPADPGCGIAFVVVQHLAPEHGSVLAEILAGVTALGVSQIATGTEVSPGHIHVIPPNASLTIGGGRLQLVRPAEPLGHRNPIDEFFTSLAIDQGENAACVILSGTGSDGTIGLRAIKEHGGLSVAQAGAEYDGMMRSAVATGLVDYVLPAETIAERLGAYFRQVTRTLEERSHGREQPDPTEHLEQIAQLLRAQTGHDFANYKSRTIVRRIQRRMHVLQMDSVAAFIERLRQDPHEVSLLFHDLLIGVTSFSREPPAFDALESEVIPELFKDRGADDTIRVWIPGCATGEEAYSLAILLRDHAQRSSPAPKLQVFATDIDEHALSIARTGRYPVSVAKTVPQGRLERYFLREDGTYRIAGDLREICLFSQHNLLRDAPFSKLDLISCRNLLIYFSASLQDRVIPLFHYALAPGGYLFLGTSENVTRHSRLFVTVDKAHRLSPADAGRAAHSRVPVDRPVRLRPPAAGCIPGPGRHCGAEPERCRRTPDPGAVFSGLCRGQCRGRPAAPAARFGVVHAVRRGRRADAEGPPAATGHADRQRRHELAGPARERPGRFGPRHDLGHAAVQGRWHAARGGCRDRGHLRAKLAEAQQQFLLGELQHRVKNILATISSLVMRMPHDGGISVEAFRDALVARVAAMGGTHELLSEGAWSGASVRALAEIALGPYAGPTKGTLRLQGDEIRISAAAATTLGMILHELATNAAKHGALSAEGGHVALSWQQTGPVGEGGPRLRLVWAEHGGPVPDASHGSGFGMRFITRAVTYELAGTVDLQLPAEGLRCTIEFPLAGESLPP